MSQKGTKYADNWSKCTLAKPYYILIFGNNGSGCNTYPHTVLLWNRTISTIRLCLSWQFYMQIVFCTQQYTSIICKQSYRYFSWVAVYTSNRSQLKKFSMWSFSLYRHLYAKKNCQLQVGLQVSLSGECCIKEWFARVMETLQTKHWTKVFTS